MKIGPGITEAQFCYFCAIFAFKEFENTINSLCQKGKQKQLETKSQLSGEATLRRLKMNLKLNMIPFNANRKEIIIHLQSFENVQVSCNVFPFKYRKTYTGVQAFLLYMRHQQQGFFNSQRIHVFLFFIFVIKQQWSFCGHLQHNRQGDLTSVFSGECQSKL